MTAYLSFEWFKVTRRWMPRVILMLLIGLIILFFWGQGTRSEDQGNLFLPRGWLVVLIFASFFAPFFWPVLGASWAGNEYGWGSIRMVLTRKPYRIEHAMAALIILLIAVGLSLVALVVVGTVAGALVGVFTGNNAWTPNIFDGAFVGTLVKSYFAAWYVSAFYLLLSYAAGVIFRSAAVGIGVAIGSTLAEFILRGIFEQLGGFWKTIAEHFPVFYTADLTTRVAGSALIPGSNMARVDSGVPGAQESLVVLAIFMVIFLAATMAALRVRDVTA